MIVSPRRILWPTDFSDLSLHGGRYACGFRDVFKAELHIIHVIPPPLSPDIAVIVPAEVPVAISEPELLDAARQSLRQLIREHFGDDPSIVHDVFYGSPWTTICRYARDHDIDLIIIATHGHTGLRHVLIGSTAERIVQHAPCPVLTVKHPQREFVVNDQSRRA